MPIIPIREVGSVGVVTDRESYDLPLTAWTSVRNIRFSNNTLSRYSVFKKLNDPVTIPANPNGVFDGSNVGEFGYALLTTTDGTIHQINNGLIEDVSPATAMISAGNTQMTSTVLGGVTYINLENNTPVYRYKVGDGGFNYIPAWTEGEHCKSLRAFKDFLIALNVTKDIDTYNNMVKWSNAAEVGIPPADWDVTDTASLAGENVLNDATGELVDGFPMGNSFILYGTQEVYRMDYIGAPLVFATDKLFPDGGIMAKNCVVEVDGKHYVFGQNDIYVHDGTSKLSIVDGRVRDFIYNRIDMTDRARFHVVQDEAHNEIMFCYRTNDTSVEFPIGDVPVGCNEAAVYNYRSDTWTFVDLPGSVAGCQTRQPKTLSWEDMVSWNNIETSWNILEGDRPSTTALITDTAGSFDPNLYWLDELYQGSTNNPPETDLLFEGWVERRNLDLDAIGATIGNRKQLNAFFPQITTGDPNGHVKVVLGSTDHPNVSVQWGPAIEFYPWTDYKQDSRFNGRYFSFRIEIPSGVHMQMSGFDADIMIIAQR